jgi:hypothetical protein
VFWKNKFGPFIFYNRCAIVLNYSTEAESLNNNNNNKVFVRFACIESIDQPLSCQGGGQTIDGCVGVGCMDWLCGHQTRKE